MRKRIHLIGAILFVLLLVSSCASEIPLPPKAKKGKIDLRFWDFKSNGPIRLDGEWRFAWNELLVQNEKYDKVDYYFVPGTWDKKTGSGVSLIQQGFATYSLSIQIPGYSGIYGFYLPTVGHACKIWIDGVPVYSSGKVAKTKENMVPAIAADLFFVELSSSPVNLIIQVSNFVHRTGGIDNSIWFGLEQQVSQKRFNNIFWEAFLTGSLVFMALLHFGIAYLFGKKTAPVFFALLCLNIATRNLLTGEQIISYLYPAIPWALEFKLEYLTAFSLAVPLIAVFVYDLFPAPKTRFFLSAVIGAGLLSGIFIIAAPVSMFSELLWLFEVQLILGSIYVAFLLLKAMYNQLQGSIVLSGGGFVFLITAINDMFFYQQIISVGPLAVFGFWCFLVCQAIAFTIQFLGEYNKLLRLSTNLEREVKDRTLNLQNANLALKEEIKKKEEVEKKLITLSRTDPLTKIDNRYCLNEKMDDEIGRARRYKDPLSVIMFDIDHFKKVNDNYGHDVGDDVLVKVSRLVDEMIREIDSFARWGGEEFIILVPNNKLSGAEKLAERIRESIEKADFSPVPKLTSSFGVTEFDPEEEQKAFLKRVDQCLYEAKDGGRNKVVSRMPNSH